MHRVKIRWLSCNPLCHTNTKHIINSRACSMKQPVGKAFVARPPPRLLTDYIRLCMRRQSFATCVRMYFILFLF